MFLYLKAYLKIQVLNQNISVRCNQWNVIKPICIGVLKKNKTYQNKSSCLKAASTACLLKDFRIRPRLHQYFIQYTVPLSYYQ